MTSNDWQGTRETGALQLERPISRRQLLQAGAAVGAASLLPGLDHAGAASFDVVSLAPRRGGRLRVGMVGGGTSETLNPNRQVNEIDTGRSHLLYERLVDFNPDGSLFNQLATEFSANANGAVWKIKVRPGVIFHDGSTLTADDVVYSLRYILDPSTTSEGREDIIFMTPNGIRALDPSTVEIRLDQPNAILPTNLSSRAIYIFKKGTTSFDTPNGTGPFKFKSWTRGERSLFVRHDRYRQHGGPYLDELEMISIDDPTTRINALIGGQIDAIAYLDPQFASTVLANSNLRLLQHDAGGYTCQLVEVDKAPFTDNRVRQAFRYMVDRKAVIQTALLGYGLLGNDLPCPFDPDYAHEIPQRAYDPEKAKFLLKQAGQANLTVSLYTSNVAPGMLESSVLIAEQAKKVGVTITIDKVPASQYWTDRYMKAKFECTAWGQRPLASQIAQGYNLKSASNETDWYRPDFDKITNQARMTLDPKKRHELYVATQRMLWDQGGYIIWGFYRYLDATSSKVHGIVPSSVRPLGWYTLTDAYLA